MILRFVCNFRKPGAAVRRLAIKRPMALSSSAGDEGTSSSEQKQQQHQQKPPQKPLAKIRLNSDKTVSQLVTTSNLSWLPTAARKGVKRRLIERLGDEEKARATTIVNFDPGQDFPEHSHPGGEEFLVLDGVWRDVYGAFPKYSYIRNYIGSRHSPQIGEEGVTILVKLCQMTEEHKEVEHQAWNGHPENENWVEIGTETVTKKLKSEGESQKFHQEYKLSETTGAKLRSLEHSQTVESTKEVKRSVRVRQCEFFKSPYEHTFALQFLLSGAGTTETTATTTATATGTTTTVTTIAVKVVEVTARMMNAKKWRKKCQCNTKKSYHQQQKQQEQQ
eukprot:TRINITY_DN7886_c1_g1_i1.p1 TRINITY_DN7886_c1_g1~~TRINITY_DN7886_c1_g1_i1.p1  ORF type:complete len:334 (-),score=64.93 TRINITY_DN7886_c1_g1_i1:58-1059(-)